MFILYTYNFECVYNFIKKITYLDFLQYTDKLTAAIAVPLI